ncbi:endo-1,3 [Cucumis melo var. makuwa]|uniref:Endo-1,3 n=1 Tax=Cucumis melo var. makuwa TaxID=1194695 RepID=A0A5A7U2E0_CUCMM|nr:endo-1,3 [Cucumis melo var. makuwa]TYK16082.1 endo-1,3 [Cucumis melo var. makuwa]
MSGPQCCSNPPTLNPSSGAGHIEQLGGLTTYVSGSPDSKRAILFITDVYGFEAPLVRKLADKVAAAGFFVVAPDFFHGDPFVPDDANRTISVWLQDHGPDKGFDDAKPVVEALKNKGISAIGAAGVCWGAKVVVELAKVELIQAAVLLHPSLVTVDDIKGHFLKYETISSFWGQSSHFNIESRDRSNSPPELLKQFEEILSAKPEVDGFVKIFPKVSHGWTVRYNVEDAEAIKCADEAHEDLLAWFTKASVFVEADEFVGSEHDFLFGIVAFGSLKPSCRRGVLYALGSFDWQ